MRHVMMPVAVLRSGLRGGGKRERGEDDKRGFHSGLNVADGPEITTAAGARRFMTAI